MSNNNGDDERDGERRELAFILLVPILGLSLLPISGSPANDACSVSNRLCVVNPAFWAITVSTTIVPSGGTCTTSAIYVEGDGGNTLSVTTPGGSVLAYNMYVLFDFDVHVTVAGTTGKVTLFETGFGIASAPAISREMIVSGIGVNVEESGSLQSGGIVFGANVNDVFGIAIMRTAGLGSICIDGMEGVGYPLGVGGTAG